jgi:hypothetical protein
LEARIPDIRTILIRHASASLGRQEFDGWDEYFKFAFVRNPWDRLVSWYTMVTTYPRGGNELWQYVRDNSSNFEEFIYNCTDDVPIRKGVYYSFARNQLDYVTDENGELLVDFIGKLENFDEDIHKVFSRIGVDLERIPRKNRSRHQHYSTFYTPETEMIVRERFERDIEYFGYEFERPPASQDAGAEASFGPRQGTPEKIGVESPRATGTETRADPAPRERPQGKKGFLFVCGCDGSGTRVLADYLNRHPEILIYEEDSAAEQQQEVVIPDLSTETSPGKDPASVRWIGASNSGYIRRMESIAGNNPGARFIIVYRPIEEIAESWEATNAGEDGFEQAARTWSKSLQGTRRFIRESPIPRTLLVSYHDLLHRSENVVPVISRFLGLALDAQFVENHTEETLLSEGGLRPGEALSEESRSSIQKHANRAAEAWILDRIDKQWKRPALYTQKTSRDALVASLNEMEARTWRLQQRVKELERDRERRRQRFKQLKNSRTWKLVHKISAVRARIVGR